MTEEIIKNLGPLAPLAGTWEGDKGDDIAPDDDKKSEENNKFREQMILEPMGPVRNHEQTLYGLRYSLTAWRIGEADAFHEDRGYYLWDPDNKQAMRCTIVPRGVSIIAGGTVEPNAKEFSLAAEVGSETYGICSNKFLDQEFKTVRFEMKITIHGNDSFSYDQDTQIKIKENPDLFHHTDKNTLNRVG
ncbi:MAG: DUF1794 domain-containing protein [Nitrospinae bacterium]|nr:DUF1794 domain-containing protein [Nitrospinota bacterium]MZH05572.1 DUF1794 domain-containing protein [Nitrospinota bacterium]MZH14855.1 DUF1794 domain-containing protein [Nitrospinota bacterium]